ncbi:MAG: GNAT family N-acetyltransferase [Nanoarchaeota archaeon]
MRLQLVQDFEELEESVRIAWNAIVADNNYSPFSSAGYAAAWISAFGDILPPQIYLAFAGSNLIGVAPLMLEEGILKFIGGGMYDDTSDYCDFVVRNEFEYEVMPLFIEALTAHGKYLLDQVPSRSKTLDFFQERDDSSRTSLIKLPGSWEDYLRLLQAGDRKDVLYYLNKLSRDFPDATYSITQKSDLGKTAEQLLSFHQKVWSEKGEGFFGLDEKGRRSVQFVRGLVEKIPEKIRISSVKRQDELFAMNFGFVDGSTVYHYLAVTNPEKKAYSPGKVLLANDIQTAIREGLICFDFMRGSDPYKNRFGVVWDSNKRVAHV